MFSGLKFGLPVVSLLFSGWMAPPSAWAGAQEDFVPHKALYSLSLKDSSGKSDVVAVGGKMAFEWSDTCDGWAINQRNLMILQNAEGITSGVDSVMSTWEAKDKSSFRFLVKKEFGQGDFEAVEGRAEVPTDGTAPSAQFVAPDEVSVDLPKDVLFPTMHTFELLDRAAAGQALFSAPIFDGSEFEGASFVSAVIGKQKTPEAASDPLISGPYWPVRLAFFGPENNEEVPDYELRIDLHPNGIARHLEIHFKDFTVNVELQRLEWIEGGGC